VIFGSDYELAAKKMLRAILKNKKTKQQQQMTLFRNFVDGT
jgi:hypothetical protein